MEILEVNFADLTGHIFNGYDLHIALNSLGHDAKQVVRKKLSNSNTVITLSNDQFLVDQLQEWEKQYSVRNVVLPYGYALERLEEFQTADIVHYHIMFTQMVSLFDYPKLMNQKHSVWTVHDPWIITGNCIYPLECQKWKTGCGNCNRIHDSMCYMSHDNTAFMWTLKKKILSQVNPDIVVSCDFMKKYLQDSPMTKHFDKIHVIPFGLDIKKYDLQKKETYKKKFGINKDHLLIGFRAENNYIKGCQYLYNALDQLDIKQKVKLICVGNGTIPENIRNKYDLIELGWISDEQKMIEFMEACDIFIMPSLAETFGLMAIEALAAGCAFICFQSTVMEEITEAPRCGIAVNYQSSEAVASEINQLVMHPEEIMRRGKLGHELVKQKYTFNEYVTQHKKLYEEILARGENNVESR